MSGENGRGADGAKPVVAIVQARMGSTRLAGKTLADLCGKPLLEHIVDRVRASCTVDDLWIATTTAAEDRAILDLAGRLGVAAYAGSPDDVLDRYAQAARRAGAATIVRITADDPFKDPDVVDLVVAALHADPTLDYASNTLRPTFPEGLDVECFTRAALERAFAEAALPSEREHVTPYLWKHPERFRLKSVEHAEDLSAWRWTLDYEADLRFTRAVYERLYRGQVFKMDEIVRLLREHPELAALNAGVARNAGYLQSLAAEAQPSAPASPKGAR